MANISRMWNRTLIMQMHDFFFLFSAAFHTACCWEGRSNGKLPGGNQRQYHLGRYYGFTLLTKRLKGNITLKNNYFEWRKNDKFNLRRWQKHSPGFYWSQIVIRFLWHLFLITVIQMSLAVKRTDEATCKFRRSF